MSDKFSTNTSDLVFLQDDAAIERFLKERGRPLTLPDWAQPVDPAPTEPDAAEDVPGGQPA
jgi:hypothetical protein